MKTKTIKQRPSLDGLAERTICLLEKEQRAIKGGSVDKTIEDEDPTMNGGWLPELVISASPIAKSSYSLESSGFNTGSNMGGGGGYGVAGFTSYGYASGGGEAYSSGGGGGGAKSCPDCLNPATVGKNLLGLSYPGGKNPLTNSGDYSYSYIPQNLAEYPAIGHDKRYDNLGIKGASGLFTDTRATGADWKFVSEQLSIAVNPFIDNKSRLDAGILGIGLAVSALPKTVFQLSNPILGGGGAAAAWYNLSSIGVTNAPVIHKHAQ